LEKNTLTEAENLRCDISNEDFHAAVQEIIYQLGKPVLYCLKNQSTIKRFLE
jgi:hypothetical protein